MKRRLITLAIFTYAFFYAVAAFAQTPSPPGTITVLNATTIITTTLAFVLALAVNSFNTGKFIGIVVTPQPWLPYIGVGIPFLSAVLATFKEATSLTGAVVFNALFAGLFALVGSGGGAAIHRSLSDHFELPKRTLAARKAKVAAAAVGVSLIALLCGCNGSLPPAPTNLPPDVNNELACVSTDIFVNHVIDVGQVAKDCTNNELAVAADLVTWLLEFDSVRAKLSTDAIATLLVNAHEARITAAQTKKEGEAK